MIDRPLLALAAAVASSLALAGCGPDTTTGGPVFEAAGKDSAAADGAVAGDHGAADTGRGRASCSNDTGCVDPAAPHCERMSGSCVPCLLHHHCDDGEVCVGNACAPGGTCKSDKDCAKLGGICDKADGRCGDCTTDVDCSDLRACVLAHCLAPSSPCTTSKQCAGLGGVCEKSIGICVECAGAEDCPSQYSCTSTYCVPQ